MSYTEYFDLFYAAQKKDCKNKAFLIDVKNSRNDLASYEEYHKYHLAVDYITKKLAKLGCLLQDENNVMCILLDKDQYHPHIDSLKRNPMITGDASCFFVKADSISDKEFIKILCSAITKFDINFSFHFMSGKYETDSYAEGKTKMYRGYMLPMLEYLSKINGTLIDKNYISKNMQKCDEKWQ